MSWDILSWTPADGSNPDGSGAIVDLAPMFKSALDEAVSALLMGAVAVTAVDVARVAATDLPDGFVAVSTYELLGTTRRTIRVGVAPDAAPSLAGVAVDAPAIGRCLVDGLDGALVAIVGEGLGLGDADPAVTPDGDLILFRLTLTDGDAGSTQVVVAVDAATPVEFSTHVVALQALGGDVAHATVPAAVPAPSSPASLGAATATTAATASTAATAAGALAQVSVPGFPTGAPAATALPALPPNVRPLAFDELGAGSPSGGSQSIEMLLGVSLQVTVEIGRTKLPIRDVLSLTPGSIVELDKLAGEKVDVLVNGHRIASGEVVVVDDNFGVRVTDVVSRHRRILSADGAA
jgi:flagellar motor switch protein FliN